MKFIKGTRDIRAIALTLIFGLILSLELVSIVLSGKAFGSDSGYIFDPGKVDNIKKGQYINLLAKVSNIDILYTRGNKNVNFIFSDVKSTDPYAKALVDAQYLGFIKVNKNNAIMPNELVSFDMAIQLATKYYCHCTNNNSTSAANKFSEYILNVFNKNYKYTPKNISPKQADFIAGNLKVKIAIDNRKQNSKPPSDTKIYTNVSASTFTSNGKIIIRLKFRNNVPGKYIKVLSFYPEYANGGQAYVYVSFTIINSKADSKATLTIDQPPFGNKCTVTPIYYPSK